MSVLSNNLRFLRGKRNLSQQKLADVIFITRVRFSKYFHVNIDHLVSVDTRKYPLEEMLNLLDNRILVPITVYASGKNQIEIIPQKASMGYLNGYTDPGYI